MDDLYSWSRTLMVRREILLNKKSLLEKGSLEHLLL